MSSFSSVILRVSLAVFFLLALSHCRGETTKDVVGKITQKTTENLKGAAAGISTGIEEGRKQVTSSDGAIVIDKASELEGKIVVEIVKHVQSEGGVHISVGFSNVTEQAYRITGLFGNDLILALDPNGFVARAKNPVADLTVPPRAKDLAVFHFDAKETPFSHLRAFGTDHPLPAPSLAPSQPSTDSASPT
ncbi:MAG: hypothetical protein FWG75_02925 [Cystobacterineae bacterium]|nr:hypothetical protein [Cystobacterineae bacterium]